MIIEADAQGREVECSVIGNSGLGAGADTVETSLPGAIVAKASEWYDFEAKYDEGGMELVVPAPIGDDGDRDRSASSPPACSARSAAPASPAATSSSATTGEVLVNEINTIPGFTETSVFGKLFEATGVAYPELCDRLVELAVERHRREREFRF